MDEYTTLQTCDANIRRPQNILDKIVINSCSAICFISAVLLMVIITVAALCRYIFEVDLYGYEEWAKMLAFWLYFMGAGIGAFNASHVSADLVQVYVKPGRIKTVLTCIRSFFTMLVSILFTWYGYRLFIFGSKGPRGIGLGIPETPLWGIPFWTSYLAIFIGMVIMSWYFLLEFIHIFRKILERSS